MRRVCRHSDGGGAVCHVGCAGCDAGCEKDGAECGEGAEVVLHRDVLLRKISRIKCEWILRKKCFVWREVGF